MASKVVRAEGMPPVELRSPVFDFLDRLDARLVPRYSLAHSSFLLRVPVTTMKRWFGAGGILDPAAPGRLSFQDIASAHALRAFRELGLTSADMRATVQYYQSHFGPVAHPLLQEDFCTRGPNIVLPRAGQLINMTRGGQL